MSAQALALLIRTIRMCCEYHAGLMATLNPLYAWGLADAQAEIALIVRDGAA